VSKFAVVLISALACALSFSSAAEAKSVSKYCKLLSSRDIGRPLGDPSIRTRSVTLAYPSEKKSNKGRVTFCSHMSPTDLVAQTSVVKFGSNAAAKSEFAAVVHREKKSVKVVKTSGPWNDAYYMGRDGFIVLKGRFMFHLQYASETHGIQGVTQKVVTSLSAKAARKL
jgi:hypothetical protein